MQITEIIPRVVENEIPQLEINQIIFQNWKVDHYCFPTIGIIYYTNSGFVILIYTYF